MKGLLAVLIGIGLLWLLVRDAPGMGFVGRSAGWLVTGLLRGLAFMGATAFDAMATGVLAIAHAASGQGARLGDDLHGWLVRTNDRLFWLVLR